MWPPSSERRAFCACGGLPLQALPLLGGRALQNSSHAPAIEQVNILGFFRLFQLSAPAAPAWGAAGPSVLPLATLPQGKKGRKGAVGHATII